MNHSLSKNADDIMYVERRREPRIFLSVAGRYVFATRHTSESFREYSCRVVNVSLHAIALCAPVIGAKGARVIVHCEEFGRFEGAIIRPLSGGFAMSLAADDDMRAKLAEKITWYERIKNFDISDRRINKRIVPKDPRSVIIFPDNRQVECSVIDISITGVAVAADIRPEIGTQLTVGTLPGQVVRHLANGFAVHFTK